jgi:hypothetical protein
MRDYLRVAFQRVPIAADRRHRITRWIHEAIGFPARWRLDHGFYGLPIEIWLKNGVNRMFEGPKPMVDAARIEVEGMA